MKLCRIKSCERESEDDDYYFCKYHWAVMPEHLKEEIWKAFERRTKEPDVYSAVLDGARRLIGEWENENDDGA